MNILFRQRKSIRLKEFNYSQPGEYFLTICTNNHEYIFGNINHEEMKLSTEGTIAQRCWEEIPKHFSNVQLDEYKILLHASRVSVTGLRLPNHIHGIIILTESMVGTRHAVSLQEQFAKPVIGSVPTIVRSFKSATTKCIHEIRNTPSLPVWQGRFFDRIIRSDKELDNIRKYIFNNVLKWAYESQHENPDNL
jgi:REP element-mobilizing transposase RayT